MEVFSNTSEHTHWLAQTHCTHTEKSLFLSHTHTHSHTHLLFSHCRGTVAHHSIELTHHLLHLLPPSWGERQRGEREREQGSCELEIRFICWILCCHCWQRGFMAAALRLALRQAGIGAKGLKSLFTPPFKPEHSVSLHPPQWKMRVSTQPESKTNDYCTYETHKALHDDCCNTVWFNEQRSQLLEASVMDFAVIFFSPNILKTWIDAWNDCAGIISACWAFVPVHALKSRQTQGTLQCM